MNSWSELPVKCRGTWLLCCEFEDCLRALKARGLQNFCESSTERGHKHRPVRSRWTHRLLSGRDLKRAIEILILDMRCWIFWPNCRCMHMSAILLFSPLLMKKQWKNYCKSECFRVMLPETSQERRERFRSWKAKAISISNQRCTFPKT